MIVVNEQTYFLDKILQQSESSIVFKSRKEKDDGEVAIKIYRFPD
jgi:hypothetical protein